MEKELNYIEDVRIDKNNLDDCLINQAELRAKWNAAWAEATKEKQLAKRKLDLVTSELEQEARSNWEVLGFAKAPTDQMVKNWIPTQDLYDAANLDLIDKTYKVNVLSGAKDAFDDRRTGLTDIIKLWLNNYYADENMIGKEARDLLEEIRRDKSVEQLNKEDQKKKLKRR